MQSLHLSTTYHLRTKVSLLIKIADLVIELSSFVIYTLFYDMFD